MSNWRDKLGLKTAEPPQAVQETPAAPAESNVKTKCDQWDYDRLKNLTMQAGAGESYLKNELTERGVVLDNWALTGFTKEISDEIEKKLVDLREQLKTIEFSKEKLQELFNAAKKEKKLPQLKNELAAHDVAIACSDGDRVMTCEGFTAYIDAMIRWQMFGAERPELPKPAKREKEKPSPVGPSPESGTTVEPSTETPPGDSDKGYTLRETSFLPDEPPVEPPAEQPAPLLPAQIDQGGRQIFDEETGEILNPGAYFAMIGLEDEQLDKFQIRTQEDVEWLIGRIRATQHEIRDIGFQAMSKIRERCAGITGLMFHYGLQLRQVAEPEWKRAKSGKKVGQISEAKNRKYDNGATIFWGKTGGLKLAEGHRWRSFIAQVVDEVAAGKRPASDIDLYMIKITVGYDYNRMRAHLNTLTPEEVTAYPGWVKDIELETGDMKIGGPNEKGEQKPWTFGSFKKLLVERLKTISIKGERQDEEDEDSE